MPKMKSNRSAAKRFRRTASGKFKHGQAGKGHLMTKKSSSRKRQLRRPATASKADQKRIERLLPV
ncbi:MAG: 50S ribosomal protein L35 [Candidatus Lindowbacteria bacterium]|nr:50S ribosomal protein L35 [Candidatus Lindowbacteria bacterium]